MILDAGEKVHLIERRCSAEDVCRYLIGEVIKSSENTLRVKGYVWVFDAMKGFVRKPEVRERVIYPSDRTTINIIPKEVDLAKIKYVSVPQKSLVLTDGEKFTLDINEFGAMR